MAGGLERYRQKRDFAQTPEPPPGEPAPATASPSFVVQKHAARRLHYDFRLEHGGVLKSWAVTKGPSLDPADKRLAVETEDHPLDYGNFEGTIPEKAYGAGTVMLWDRGTWRMVDGKEAEEGFEKGSLTFELFGERMRGRWHLQRLKGEPSRPPQWLLIKGRDEAAQDGGKPLTERYTKSVATGRTMRAIADAPPADAPPDFIAPMLCRSAKKPPAGEGWLAEVKYDGYRIILRAAADGVRLLTRNRKDYTRRFPTIADAAAALQPRNAMLDGEAVVFDAEGRTDFGALQQQDKSGGTIAAVYVAFDCLFLDGTDLRDRPIEQRKAALRALLGEGAIRYGDHVAGRQMELFEQARALGLEGIIAKRAGSAYRSGRHDAWVKVRAVRTAAFVIGGYTLSPDRGLGALLLGAYDGDRLVPVGRVGTGFSAGQARSLSDRLTALEAPRSPFAAKIAGRGHRWVDPELVATVEYLAITGDGQLRHPAYKGLARKEARTVRLPADHPRKLGARPEPLAAPAVLAAPEGDTFCGVTLTNPDKVLFPESGLTKMALAAHYMAHMERALPHIAGRPLTLVRCPQGRAKKCFFQRHPAGLPDRLAREIGEDEAAIVVQRPQDVIELVQKGTLEIHLRGARADRPDRPDRIVFDLDPGEAVGFEAVKDAAVTLRDRLAQVDLAAFVKTTGGKGLHVVVPIERRTPWAEAKAWARAVAAALARAEPDRFLINMAKAKRRGRIFIDYLRNDTKSSAVAPYSTRAREGAPFALPVSWEALTEFEGPVPVSVGQVVTGPDPWAEMDTVRQRLGKPQWEALRQ